MKKTIKLKGERTPAFMDRLSGRLDKDIIVVEEEDNKMVISSAWIKARDANLQAFTAEVFASTAKLISNQAKTIACQLHRISEIDELLDSLNRNLGNVSEENKNVFARKQEAIYNQITALKKEQNELEKQVHEVKIDIEQIKHNGYQTAILGKERSLYRVAQYIRGSKLKVNKDVDCGIVDHKCFKTYEVFSAYLDNFLKGE